MYTYFKSKMLSFFKEKRLAFMGGLTKGPSAEEVIKKIDAKTETDKEVAADLKDEKVLWSKSAKEGGAVFDFMKKVKKNVDSIEIPKEVQKEKANKVFEEYGTDPAAGTAALSQLNTHWDGEDAAQFILDKAAAAKKVTDAAKPDDNPEETAKAAKAASDAVTKAEAPWDATTAFAALPGQTPKALQDAVQNAGSRDNAKKACNEFKANQEIAEANSIAADAIDKHKKDLVKDIESIAVSIVHEKQKAFFDSERTAYIGLKVEELAPKVTEEVLSHIDVGLDGKSKDPASIEAARQSARDFNNSQRANAALYLQSLLSSAELTVGGSHTDGAIKTEFDSKYGKKGDHEQFLVNVSLPKGERVSVSDEPAPEFVSDDLDDVGGKPASPEIRAYVEGLINSLGLSGEGKEDAKQAYMKMVKLRIQSLPPKERNNLDAVKSALSTMHMEQALITNTDPEIASHYMADETDEDIEASTPYEYDKPEVVKEKKSLGKAMDKAYEVLEKNPMVQSFLMQRMSIANDFYKDTPNHKENMRDYRNMLLRAIGQQDPEKVNMAALRRLEKPSTFKAGARKLKELPDGVTSATGRMLPGTGEYATKLWKRLRANNAADGTVIEFKYKTVVYYAKFYNQGPGGRNNLVIYMAPEGKRAKPAETVAPAEEPAPEAPAPAEPEAAPETLPKHLAT
jgi:osmotically-inducible protein OsmY